MTVSHPNLSPAYLAEENNSALRIICIVFLVLNTIFVALRFTARHYQSASWGWDDLFIAISWLTACGLCVDGLLAPRWGAGFHIERVTTTMPEQIPNWGRNGFYAVPIIYVLASTFPKISILILYLRVFVDRFSRYCCWILLAVLTLSAIINNFVTGFQCNSQEASWNTELPGRHCHNIQAHLTYGPLTNMVTDVAMLLLPIPVVLRLQTATHVKVGLFATFLVASAGLVTSIIRFAEFFINPYAEDPTWYASPLIMWVTIESSIYLICASLLTFRAILAKVVYSKQISTLYSWIRRTTGSGTDRSSRSGDSAKRRRYGRDAAPILPVAHKKSGSSEAFASQDEGYDLPSYVERPGEIHVQQEFSMSSRRTKS